MEKNRIVLLGSGRFAAAVYTRCVEWVRKKEQAQQNQDAERLTKFDWNDGVWQNKSVNPDEPGFVFSGIFSYPPKERGRGHNLFKDPVAELAEQHGISLHESDDYTADSDAAKALQEIKPDLAIVLSFRILPPEIVATPRRGFLNLHPSMLPDLRGAAPLNWAIARGYTQSGFTTFLLNNKVDSGDIVLQTEWNILPDENVNELALRLVEPAAEHILRSISIALVDNPVLMPQDHTKATSAPKIAPKHLRIDWTRSNRDIHNQVRGFYPQVNTMYNGKKVNIERTQPVDGNLRPGEVGKTTDRGFIVGCGEGALIIEMLKPEGKKSMDGLSFCNGYVRKGARFQQV